MTDITSNQVTDGNPTYVRGSDPAGRFADYYPAWLDNLADDVTIEGSLLGRTATTAGSRTTPLRSAVSRPTLGMPSTSSPASPKDGRCTTAVIQGGST